MNTKTQEALKQHAEKYGLTLDQFKMMCEGASKTYEGQGMISTDYALAREAYFAGFSKACKEALAQPAQEPVSLGDFDRMTKAECVDYIDYLRKEIDLLRFKEWQGLSISDEDDFIQQCYMIKTESEAHQLVLDIEKTLRIKNAIS